jgi:dihydroorotase
MVSPVFYSIIIYYLLDNAPHSSEEAVSTRSSPAKYCPPHSLILAASSFEKVEKKNILKLFLAKTIKNRNNLKTYE